MRSAPIRGGVAAPGCEEWYPYTVIQCVRTDGWEMNRVEKIGKKIVVFGFVGKRSVDECHCLPTHAKFRVWCF